MNVQKYDVKKFSRVVETTLSNYAHMIKRLERKKCVSEFVLIYYSVFLIIATLTGKYFPNCYNAVVSEYFNIILSVIVLIYSLIVKNANYSARIANIMNSLNQLKSIKREIKEDSLQECNRKYNEIVDKTECRDDVDFFVTIKNLCKAYQINWLTKNERKTLLLENTICDEEKKRVDDIKGYLSEINVIIEQSKIIISFLWDGILFVVPIVLFGLCILAKQYGI